MRGVTRLLPSCALALVGLSLASSPAMAGTPGASCTAQSMAFTAVDTGSFTWSLPAALLQSGTARVQVSPAGSGAFTTLSSSSVRTAGQRTATGALTALGTGNWDWRMLVTEWDGATFSCNGPVFAVTRLPAPSLGFSGTRITTDGWRVPESGQSVSVVPALGDVAPATAWVRFRYASGSWSSWTSATASIPSSDITSIQAYRRTSTLLNGIVSTTPVKKDTTAPVTPVPISATAQVGPNGVDVAFVQSTDTGSGIAGHQSRLIDDDDAQGPWQPIAGPTAFVGPGTAGGTLLIRACDRVGNCSASAQVSLVPLTLPAPIDDPALDDPDSAVPGAGGPSRSGESSRRVSSTPPRITALVAAPPRGGAGRVIVELSRPAEVTFTVGPRTVARVWLGQGRTAVRLPPLGRRTRGTLTARPASGQAVGDPVTTTVTLPAGGRKGEAERRVTRARPGASAVLYDMDAAVREVVAPSDGGMGLGHDRGALRQEPSTSGLFHPDDDGSQMGKITEEHIRGLSGPQMAEVIREVIEDAPGHLAGFDELTPAEADPPAPVVRGGRIPAPDPGSPGFALAQALRILDTPSPYGGTWSSRVHVYIAPAVTSAMAAGLGPNRNLGRDGKARFRTYRTVMTGLARAGAIWIEAYHGKTVPLQPFTVREWQRAPAAFTAEYRRAGGDPSRLHFLLTGTDAYPAGRLPAGCITPQGCQWALAEATPAGRAIIANGVGGYRLGPHARPWLAEWQARVS